MQEITAEWAKSPTRPVILIVDDNVEIIKTLAALLNDAAEIRFATTPEQGIMLAAKTHPDLLLLDVEMPRLNGFEVCRQLKADPITADIAIIFVTGHANSEHEVAALEAGAADFIGKPLMPAVVRARVKTQLSLIEKTKLLTKLAKIDGLTGIYNRRYFDTQLEQELRRHQRLSTSLGVAIVDIDYFKAYNDGYGHVKGDECLREVAQIINASTRRPGEIVARYGGEEFTIILPAIEESSARQYGDWICEHVRARQLEHAFSQIAPIVTVSVGVTCFVPRQGDVSSEIVSLADQALYLAKEHGRNRGEFKFRQD
jgi:diguanylate cyclase (GGDEF)-like protein